jgi:hypothetical protein
VVTKKKEIISCGKCGKIVLSTKHFLNCEKNQVSKDLIVRIEQKGDI